MSGYEIAIANISIATSFIMAYLGINLKPTDLNILGNGELILNKTLRSVLLAFSVILLTNTLGMALEIVDINNTGSLDNLHDNILSNSYELTIWLQRIWLIILSIDYVWSIFKVLNKAVSNKRILQSDRPVPSRF